MAWIIEYDDGQGNCGRETVFGGIDALFARLANLTGCTKKWRRAR